MLGHQADATRWVHGFDVFTLSSCHEGLPMALMEAMELGVAPVVTRAGGMPEAMDHGLTGYWCHSLFSSYLNIG